MTALGRVVMLHGLWLDSSRWLERDYFRWILDNEWAGHRHFYQAKLRLSVMFLEKGNIQDAYRFIHRDA